MLPDPDLKRIGAFWREHSSTLEEQLNREVRAKAGPEYSAMSREQLSINTLRLIEVWQYAFDNQDSIAIRNLSREIGHQRAEANISLMSMLQVTDIMRGIIWEALQEIYADGDWDIATIALTERWIHEMNSGFANSYGETLQESQQRLSERQNAIDMQNRLIRELSAPIMPIHDGVLVMPLVGAIDTHRATQIMESVLEQIVAEQASVLILDITGVPFIDTGVANHLLQMTRAVTLLGAQVVLVGIGAEVAQTLIQLGIDLSSIVTKANLGEGIDYALDLMDLQIQPIHSV